MRKLIGRRSKKAGLPPGSLVHVGEKKTEDVKITVIEYDETRLQESSIRAPDGWEKPKDSSSVTWIDVEGIHSVENMERIGACYGFHPLMLEDILNTEQRPKIDYYDDYIFMVMKMLHYDDASDEIVTDQISLVLGKNYLISFQEGGRNAFRQIVDRMRNGKSRIRKMGADYLAYGLLDAVVDNYFVVLEKLGEKIEILEENLVTESTPLTMHSIHALRREMILLRKSIWPLREVIGNLEREDSALIKPSSVIYLRDVYDHTVQVIDTMETFRDMLTGMLDVYLSSISNRLNAVMKVLTIIATIFMPLTFIAGVYGMNFKNMPELEWPWGYPAIWLVMLTTALSMLIYFKAKKWL